MMNKKIAYALYAVAFVAFFVSANFIYAQISDLVVNTPNDATQPPPDFPDFVEPVGNANCFDYYSFGSVQANISATLTGTVPGAPMVFKGSLRNDNPYPIIDGALYVKVFRLRESAEKNPNGPHVVDQFFVKKGIVLPANGSVPVEFQWRVPAYVVAGEYQVATFFTSAQKYNLLGLSFTDDIVGNTVNFSVRGERRDGIYFDKDSVTVNDERYYFAAFPPRVDKNNPVIVKARVKNTTNRQQIVKIDWKGYHWDTLRHENLLAQTSYAVSVPARGEKEVSFTIEDNQYPVYIAQATLSYKDTKSILNVRFVRDGINRPRINYPAVTSYPLKKGEGVTLFSCLHNTNDATTQGNLELTVLDKQQNIIHTYTYSGAITGAMMGVKSDFIPKKDYDTFTIQAHLFSGGELVDEEYMTYDCNKFGLCAPGAESPFPDFEFAGERVRAIPYIIFALMALVLVLGVGAFLYFRRDKGGDGVV